MFAMPRVTPFTKKLLIALAISFLAVTIADVWLIGYTGFPVFESLSLRPDYLGPLTAAQVIAYPFVYPPTRDGVMAVLFSMLGVWWMLSPHDERFGRAFVIKMMVIAQLFAATAALGVGWAFPSTIVSPLFGAGSWTLAALSAFAAIHWRATINFFVMPMPAWGALVLALGLSALGFLMSRDVPNFAADLGCIGAGWLWAKWWMRPRTKPKKVKTRGNGNRPAFRIIQGGREEEEDDDDSGPRDRPRWLN